MPQFIVRRLLISIPFLFGFLVVVFVIARLLPGDPFHILLGERANPLVCADFSHRYGFDRSILEQFTTYLGNFFHGDLGSSFRTSRSVTSLLLERLPMTVELAIYALVFATIMGILLGVIS